MAAGVSAEPHSASRPELKALTGIRAVAAIMVVMSHVGLPKTAPPLLTKFVESGYIGVPLFFILSGFVLAYNYADIDPRSPRQLWRFYVARAARVLPLYYVILVFLAVTVAAKDGSLRYLGSHLLNIQTWSPSLTEAQQTFNGPAWSINVELFFYALFPILMPIAAIVARRLSTYGVVGLTVAVMAVQWAACIIFTINGWADLRASDPMSGHRWIYRNPLFRLPDFIIGILLADLFRRGLLQRSRWNTVLQLGSLALVVVLTLVRPWEGPHAGIWRVASFGALYSLPFSVLLLSLASQRGVVARWMSTKPMLTLGVASFAVYLTHRPFLEALGARTVQASDDIAGWVLVPLVVGFTLIIGEGAHRYIEVPCRRALLRLAPRSSSDSVSVPPTSSRSSGSRPDPAPPSPAPADASPGELTSTLSSSS